MHAHTSVQAGGDVGQRMPPLSPVYGGALAHPLPEPGAHPLTPSASAYESGWHPDAPAESCRGADPQDVATAALFFATKVEDTPKRAREVLIASLSVLGNAAAAATDGQAAAVPSLDRAPAHLAWPAWTKSDVVEGGVSASQFVRSQREAIILLERELMEVAGYFFANEFSQSFAIAYAKMLGCTVARATC